MVTAASQTPSFQVPTLPVRRFTVVEYHKMIATAILSEDDNVELLRGLIVPKMSRNPPHDSILDMTNESLRVRLPAIWRIRIQSAITTVDSEPEPDLAVVRGPANRYARSHPQGVDIGMLVEVSDTSLERDRHEKGPIFAAAAIPYFWIVNVPAQTVEVYSVPTPNGYQQRNDFHPGDHVPLILDSQQLGAIPVAELFAGI